MNLGDAEQQTAVRKDSLRIAISSDFIFFIKNASQMTVILDKRPSVSCYYVCVFTKKMKVPS